MTKYSSTPLGNPVMDQKGQAIILEPITEWHTLKARYSNSVIAGGEFQNPQARAKPPSTCTNQTDPEAYGTS